VYRSIDQHAWTISAICRTLRLPSSPIASLPWNVTNRVLSSVDLHGGTPATVVLAATPREFAGLDITVYRCGRRDIKTFPRRIRGHCVSNAGDET
jgi:hypothetical protein